MNYSNEAKMASAIVGAQANRLIDAPSPTILENINRQIEMHRNEIERLQRTKEHMASGQSLLGMRIEDLRRVMNY